ncbi:hypothetical protein BEL01nite_10330 [Bradyrhizobium elkanii]|nr:hypothetical protein BEL01nite_10330 [Bradyrhizobium elkanii]
MVVDSAGTARAPRPNVTEASDSSIAVGADPAAIGSPANSEFGCMRITSKVHASRMPAAAAWKIKEIARSALQRPDSFWAIRGSNCMQFERPIALAV